MRKSAKTFKEKVYVKKANRNAVGSDQRTNEKWNAF